MVKSQNAGKWHRHVVLPGANEAPAPVIGERGPDS